MSQGQTEPLLVTKREAARLLGVSESTIDNLIRSEQLPTRQVRSRRLIEYAALRELATGETVEPEK